MIFLGKTTSRLDEQAGLGMWMGGMDCPCALIAHALRDALRARDAPTHRGPLATRALWLMWGEPRWTWGEW